jgi:hypothetical protein
MVVLSELASEPITGKCNDNVEDDGMLLAEDQLSRSTTGSPKLPSTAASPTPPCDFVLSLTSFPEATHGKRGCKVCMFDGRTWAMKTLYCARHNVCLCTKSYSLNQPLVDVVCPMITRDFGASRYLHIKCERNRNAW